MGDESEIGAEVGVMFTLTLFHGSETGTHVSRYAFELFSKHDKITGVSSVEH